MLKHLIFQDANSVTSDRALLAADLDKSVSRADALTVVNAIGQNIGYYDNYQYLDFDPNGSRNLIAGISNEKGNVVGLMPHPEHAVETLTGPSEDGLGFFTSALKQLVGR